MMQNLLLSSYLLLIAQISAAYLPSKDGKYFFIDIENTGNNQNGFADFMSYNSIAALISSDNIEQRYGISMKTHAVAVYD